MKCLLHIGTEKTATTLLQDWLYANQQALSEQGVYLSDNLGKTNNRLLPTYFHNQLDCWSESLGIKNIAEKDALFSGFKKKFAAEVKCAANKHSLFVISSEHLSSRTRTVEEIAAIKAFLDQQFEETRIVCYFRHQADMAVSLYSTALKVSLERDLDWFLTTQVKPENDYFNFKLLADRWSEAFGREHCQYRLYQRDRFVDQDIRKDFLATFGQEVDVSALDFSLNTSNERLSRLQGIAYRVINDKIPWLDRVHGGQSSINARLKNAYAGVQSLDYGVMHSVKAEEIDACFAEINEAFLSEYFPQGTEFRSALQKTQPDRVFSLDQLEEIVAEAMVPALEELQALQERAFDRKDADTLRDIALAIERGESLDLHAARSLMDLAFRAGPDRKYIAIKACEYRAKCEALTGPEPRGRMRAPKLGMGLPLGEGLSALRKLTRKAGVGKQS